MDFILYTIFLVCLFDIVSAGEYCYSVRDGIEYCTYDCCGRTFDEHCCAVYTWIVVVAVIGGIILIGVCVCVFCMWKKKGQSGRVIGTAGTTTNVTTFNSGQPNTFNQPHHPPPSAPFAQQGQFGQQGQYGQQGPFAQQGQFVQQGPFAQQGQFGNQGFAQPGQPAYPPPSALQQNYGMDNPAYPPPPPKY